MTNEFQTQKSGFKNLIEYSINITKIIQRFKNNYLPHLYRKLTQASTNPTSVEKTNTFINTQRLKQEEVLHIKSTLMAFTNKNPVLTTSLHRFNMTNP